MKVLDFGLAKVGRTPDVAPTSRQRPSPRPVTGEVVRHGALHGAGADPRRGRRCAQRSLRAGDPPLRAGDRPAALHGRDLGRRQSAILRDTPEPLTRVRADLPGDLERIVTRCLEKNPRERVQSALDVSNELRRLRKAAERGEPATPAAPDKVASIAVLPFVNRSASADDEYFSDGLADELLNVLAKIRGLRVVARTSSFQFKGTKDDIATIGGKLNVATVLEGSVRKAGDRDPDLGAARQGRRQLPPLVGDLRPHARRHLRGAGRHRAVGGEGAAHDAPGRGRRTPTRAARRRRRWRRRRRAAAPIPRRTGSTCWRGTSSIERTREDTAKGIEYLKQALELDPEFALAWAELAGAYVVRANFSWGPVEEDYARAREAVERALALEPDLAEAHLEQGWIRDARRLGLARRGGVVRAGAGAGPAECRCAGPSRRRWRRTWVDSRTRSASIVGPSSRTR